MTSFETTQKQFADHLRDPLLNPAPVGIEERRLQIYRDLVYNNIEGFISGGFPVLRSLYADHDWHQLVRQFVVCHESHSPYFLEISQEFLAFLQNERGANQADPAFLLELAHYEWVELALDVSPEQLPVDGDTLLTHDLLQGHPVVSPLVWSLSYQYPVHLLGPAYQPEETPEQPTFLLVYRNRHDSVEFMASNALTVRLLNLLQGEESMTGREALSLLAEEMCHPNPHELIDMGHDLLKKLQNCDIIF